MRCILASLAVGALVSVSVPPAAAQSAALKTYQDPKFGVTFRYPAAWKADTTLGFYLGTAILERPHPPGGMDHPIVKVGFDRAAPIHATYPKNTILDGVEFTYLALPDTPPEACFARLPDQDGETKKSDVTIHGVAYKRVHGGDAGMSHGASRDMYAADIGGTCYLFEGGIHTSTGADDAKPLGEKQTLRLQNQIAEVMGSVKITTSGTR